MKRYAIHPGPVTSINDGDVHHVGFAALVRLYGVDPAECVNYGGPGAMHGLADSDLVHLYPRRDGNYRDVAAPQVAPAGLDPDAGTDGAGSAEDRTPISVAAWQQLHSEGEGFPMVASEDLEMTCEWCGRRIDQCGCSDVEYDESYWDAKKDDLVD